MLMMKCAQEATSKLGSKHTDTQDFSALFQAIWARRAQERALCYPTASREVPDDRSLAFLE